VLRPHPGQVNLDFQPLTVGCDVLMSLMQSRGSWLLILDLVPAVAARTDGESTHVAAILGAVLVPPGSATVDDHSPGLDRGSGRQPADTAGHPILVSVWHPFRILLVPRMREG